MTAVGSSSARATYLLTVRPHRIAVLARISATVVVVAMVVVGLLLRNSNEGVAFRVQDQVGLIGLGVLVGLAILGMGRPRLRVDETGLWVRNILGENFFDWSLVYRIGFPEGANWAQLMLPDDETHAVMAIQAIDKQRAVDALREVRALHAKYAPPAPEPAPAHEQELAREEADRPLGRLEIIDREKAAGGKKPRGR